MTRRLQPAPAAFIICLSACGARGPDIAPLAGDFAFFTIRIRGEAEEDAAAALERLLAGRYGGGARVDDGVARVRVRHPMTLELAHLAGEVEAAGFAVDGIEIQVSATVEERIVTLHPTGQKLPLEGREPMNPGPGWGTFTARAWDDPERTALEVVPWDELWIRAGGSRR